MANKMFTSVFNKMVSNFMPQEDNEARIALNGTVVVLTQTPNGKEWVDSEANIYPEEMISEIPVFTMAKPVANVAVGDIVKLTKSTFATVTAITDDKVETLSFGGQHRQAKAFKDMFLNQATVRVVINPLTGVNDNNTLMMLSMLDGNMETMMLMSMLTGNGQNPLNNLSNNPMALAFLMKGDNDAIQNILMFQMMQNGGFNNLFNKTAE
jgi:hypothetical protein